MPLRITLFGKLGDLMGRELELPKEFGGRTMADLRRFLAGEYPSAAPDLLSPRVRACVNDALVPDSHNLTAGDQIALLPPVSGG